ncbi:MAG: LysM peptidoglycan-binding domain-containing protein [Opitutaceae bacterium]|jgi:LysM repeat protein
MNILKILGIVVAVHVVAFFLMFVNPGCRSTSQGSAPIATDTAPAVGAGTATSPATNPVAAPTDSASAVSVNIPPSAVVRYSPTRPGSPAAAALESAPPADVTPATAYTVVAGDNLWNIAKKNGTTVTELEKANKLTSNSRLSVGQKLIIPGKTPAASAAAAGGADLVAAATYTVRPGDTLAGIARRAGTTTAELKRVNDLKSDYVRVGQELKLPSGAAPATGATVASPSAAASSASTAPGKKPEGSVIHVVKAGETLGAIARKYQVKVSDLAVANNIADPKKIRPGQELVIPGFTAVGGAAPATAPAASPSAAATPAAPAPTPPTTPPPPPPDQDLDAGLKPQNNVPVIKVDDTGAAKTP